MRGYQFNCRFVDRSRFLAGRNHYGPIGSVYLLQIWRVQLTFTVYKKGAQ